MNGYININGEPIIDLIDEDYYNLNSIIKKHTNDKEFIIYIEKLETNLTIVYIESVLIITIHKYFLL